MPKRHLLLLTKLPIMFGMCDKGIRDTGVHCSSKFCEHKTDHEYTDYFKGIKLKFSKRVGRGRRD